MGVNSITGHAAAVKLPSLNVAADSLNQQAKGTTPVSAPSIRKTVQSNITATSSQNKVSPPNIQSPVVNNENNRKPVRAMTHVVESYNLQGKVRIKFIDSNNNVIYQIPPEMVAKTQDLMTNTQTATDIKG